MLSLTDLKEHDHQVAGHHHSKKKHQKPLLMDGEFVLKPLVKREFQFYTQQIDLVSDLKPWIPKFGGVKQILSEDCFLEYISLENICGNLSTPNVMDLKIGTQTYEDDASDEKKHYEKTKFPLQEVVGYRVSGMKVYNGDKSMSYDRMWGRSLGLDDLDGAFRLFFTRDEILQLDVILFCIRVMERLIQVFVSQNKLKFYSSSLLFVWDLNEKGFPIVRLKMIDFAHVVTIKDESERDDGYIVGLKSILASLRKLIPEKECRE